ncbi:MAG: MBL fold metallo-hydrolase [Ruminococcaceae bacterium]|nr:MBL fold metallo-hydrolase [Oscillospiraceae bacterium]
MKIDVLHVGFLGTNCYIVTDKNKIGAVIDPGEEGDKIIRFIEKNGIDCRFVLLTHGHFDHVGALKEVLSATGAKLVASSADSENEMTPDIEAVEGLVVKVGDMDFKVLSTPGHSKDSVCYLTEEALFSGDTLFFESIGRTDFPGGDFGEMKKSLKKLRDMEIDDIAVYPGHGASTDLKYERENNPFMKML